MSIQNLILIAVDRFPSVVFPLRYPLIRPELFPFFISATRMVGTATSTTFLFAYKSVKTQSRLVCKLRWEEAFGESRCLQITFSHDFFILLHPVTTDSHTLSTHLPKADFRRANSHCYTTTTYAEKKCTQNCHCYFVRVCWLPFRVFLPLFSALCLVTRGTVVSFTSHLSPQLYSHTFL